MRDNILIKNDFRKEDKLSIGHKKKTSLKYMSKECLSQNFPIFASSSSHPNIFSLTKNIPQNVKSTQIIPLKMKNVIRSNSNSNISFKTKNDATRVKFKDVLNTNLLRNKKDNLFFQAVSSRKNKNAFPENKNNEKLFVRGGSVNSQNWNLKRAPRQKENSKYFICQKAKAENSSKNSLPVHKIKIREFFESEKRNFSKSLKNLHNSKSFLVGINTSNIGPKVEKDFSLVSAKLLSLAEKFQSQFAAFFKTKK